MVQGLGIGMFHLILTVLKSLSRTVRIRGSCRALGFVCVCVCVSVCVCVCVCVGGFEVAEENIVLRKCESSCEEARRTCFGQIHPCLQVGCDDTDDT